jgi:transposase InsO family protein
MSRKQQDTVVLEHIRSVKAEQPNWGYRLVWAYLKYQMDLPFNRKRIYRIMKEHNLLVQKNTRLKALRDSQNNRSKPKATRTNQFWGIDMTKVMIAGYGWAYLVIVLDWYTKKIVGYHISNRSKTADWLIALNNACNNNFPEGIVRKQEPLYLISDNGSQPTSQKFMQACSVLEIKQIFASYSNPKGNADTERVIKTAKHDFIWLHEFSGINDFSERFRQWLQKYNTQRPHSTLGYRTPAQFEKEQLVLTTKK